MSSLNNGRNKKLLNKWFYSVAIGLTTVIDFNMRTLNKYTLIYYIIQISHKKKRMKYNNPNDGYSLTIQTNKSLNVQI